MATVLVSREIEVLNSEELVIEILSRLQDRSFEGKNGESVTGKSLFISDQSDLKIQIDHWLSELKAKKDKVSKKKRK